MAQFHQHPDGLIYVRTTLGIYVDTVANFAADFGELSPPLPDGAVERLYDDLATAPRHLLSDARGGQISNDHGPWVFGDEAIAAMQTLLERQRARTAPPPPAPQQTGTGRTAAAVNATVF